MKVLSLFAGLLLFLSCSSDENKKAKGNWKDKKKEGTQVAVWVEECDDTTSTSIFHLGTGTYQKSAPLKIHVEANGSVLSNSFALKVGSKFRKGQTLVKVDTQRASLNYQKLESDLIRAMAQLLPAIQTDFPEELNAWQSFYEKLGEGSLPKIPNWKTGKAKGFFANANLPQLYFAAKQAELELKKHSWRAPFAGEVVSVAVTPGQYVTPNKALAEIVPQSGQELHSSISFEQSKWFEPGDLAKANVSGQEVVLKLMRIGGEYLPNSDRVGLFFQLLKGQIKSGEVFTYKLESTKPNNLCEVPLEAVFQDSIWIVADGILEKKEWIEKRIQENSSLGNYVKTTDDFWPIVVQEVPGARPGKLVKAVAKEN